jgi:hypothetical protein
MRVLLIIAFLAAVTGLEVYHALSSDATHTSVGMAAKADAIRDVVLDHSKHH